MKLTKLRITNFQSIQDSTEFDIAHVTCLVGKNEAGKTALLKALYRLNPVMESEGAFDAVEDYPRLAVSDYEDDIKTGHAEPAQVVHATYTLERDDIAAVENAFGKNCLSDNDPTVTLQKGYSNQVTFTGINLDSTAAIVHLIKEAGLPQPLTAQLLTLTAANEMMKVLSDAEQTDAVRQIGPKLDAISANDVASVVYEDILRDRIPKFLYFDEYYQMKGHDNLDALKQRLDSNALAPQDHPLVGLIDLAGLDLNQLTAPGKTQALIARLEAAENRLTQKVLTYWSQNRHLRMKFDIRPALPEDGPGMTSGTNIWGRVHDTKHMVSTALGTRSRGFVWFFSFLAWYSKLRKEEKKLILLLDEPGLSLHAKAQSDLLHYFDKELQPHHQVIYTTHSPFMVRPGQFGSVRIVQDPRIEPDSDEDSDEASGTRVTTDVLEATPDSLFPLQGALGYEIHQTLFVGPNCLVVEGVSDLLYIQTVSALLEERNQCGLSAEWTITPVGGADKVPTFVALIGAQTNLNVAVLIDYQKKDKQIIENLYKRKLLKKKSVLTFADYTGGREADIEDMFRPEFYLKLVNGTFGASIALADLPHNHPRIVRRLEQYLTTSPLPNKATFNHFRPARHLAENIGSLALELSDLELDRFKRAFDALNVILQEKDRT